MFDWLRNLICKYDSGEYREKYITCQGILHSKVMENVALTRKIRELGFTEEANKPTFLIDGFVYQPRVSVETGHVTLEPTVVYSTDGLWDYRYLWTDRANKKLTYDEKLSNIWKVVINSIQYVFDDPENWQSPMTTLTRGKGDCEDGAVLFVSLCRMAGIPSNSIFNACGYLYSGEDKIGHSWPIAKMEDGNWYVFETTIDFIPKQPLLFKGSSYKAEWGLANWKYKGAIKNGEGSNWQI